MQIQLFEKNSYITNSSVYLGYLILKKIIKSKSDRKVSIFKVVKMVSDLNPTCNAKQVIFALMFLYVAGLIEFNSPYIIGTYDEVN